MNLTKIEVDIADTETPHGAAGACLLGSFLVNSAYTLEGLSKPEMDAIVAEGELLRPGILAVGFADEKPICAATTRVSIDNPPEEGQTLGRQAFTSRPFLSVSLLVTDPQYRGCGYGGELVRGLIGFAYRTQLAWVEANHPVSDARAFWYWKGFRPYPFETDGGHMYYDCSGGNLDVNMYPSLQVSESAVEKVSQFAVESCMASTASHR